MITVIESRFNDTYDELVMGVEIDSQTKDKLSKYIERIRIIKDNLKAIFYELVRAGDGDGNGNEHLLRINVGGDTIQASTQTLLHVLENDPALWLSEIIHGPIHTSHGGSGSTLKSQHMTSVLDHTIGLIGKINTSLRHMNIKLNGRESQ